MATHTKAPISQLTIGGPQHERNVRNSISVIQDLQLQPAALKRHATHTKNASMAEIIVRVSKK